MNTFSIDANCTVTLLEVMEHRSIPVQSHCRGGYCGACRTKIVSGEVDYHIEPLAYLDDDEVLPCACKAKTALKIAVQ